MFSGISRKSVDTFLTKMILGKFRRRWHSFLVVLIENRLEFPAAPGFDGSIEECVVPVLDAHPVSNC